MRIRRLLPLFCLLPVAGQAQPGAHVHPVRVDLLAEVAGGVSLAPADPPGRASWQGLTPSPDRRYTAFTVSAGEYRLFVRDRRRGRVYEVRGIPLGYRPLSDLTWRGGHLFFDRWSQPHHGIHYEVGVPAGGRGTSYALPEPGIHWWD